MAQGQKFGAGKRFKLLARIGFLSLALAATSCLYTSVGGWDQPAYESHQYGAWRAVHVCVYLDDGVTRQTALNLMSDWLSGGTARYYRLRLVPEGFWRLPRRGFLHTSIMNEAAHIPLKGDCDRVFYFVKHTPEDYLYATLPNLVGLFPPEVLGEVDDATMTHGYAFTSGDNALSAFIGARHTTWHEFYHLLGSCPHAWSLDGCYWRLASLKKFAQYFGDNAGDGFYTSMSLNGMKIFSTREQVNATLKGFRDSAFW